MVALFVRTELASDRWHDDLQALLDQAGISAEVVTKPDLDDEAGNQARRWLLTGKRGYSDRTDYFEGFPDDVTWQWMAISADELAKVRYIEYDYWNELSGGSRLPVDAATRIRAGVTPFMIPNHRVLDLAQAVAEGAQFPPLILVTTGPGGDVVLLEGHVRLTAFILAREWLPPELEVLVGSSAGMARWDCW